MNKTLILGYRGFVGSYLKEELLHNGYEVCGADLHGDPPCNILVQAQVEELIQAEHPSVIYHMAAQSSVSKSWQNPALTFDINVKGTLHLLEAVRAASWPVRIVIVGSSEQYGKLPEESASSIQEKTELNPMTPYAISKCTQESLGILYAKVYDMDIVMTRSFNHVGVGQPKGFVIPDLCSGIVAVERGQQNVLLTGDMSAKRDFTDVRDVVRAYRLLGEHGMRGEVYNVGSGRAFSIQELLDILLSHAKVPISVQRDPDKMRPSDTPLIRCNFDKLYQATGWRPEIEIERTLTEVMDNYRKN